MGIDGGVAHTRFLRPHDYFIETKQCSGGRRPDGEFRDDFVGLFLIALVPVY